jgi:hypothetical protein
MTDYEEARQEAMEDEIAELTGEYVEQGRCDMKEAVLDILDEMIGDESNEYRYTFPQLGVLKEVRSKVKSL